MRKESDMIDLDVLNDFRSLFRGYPHAYGTYAHNQLGKSKGKQKPRQWSVKEPITDAVIKDHLEGDRPVGVYNLDENEMVGFGTIDVDIYPLDHHSISNKLVVWSIPMLVCNSKSNGAHIYVFFKQPTCPVRAVRALRQVATALGYPNAEVFPKQVRRPKGQLGNYINLPFFGSKKVNYSCFHEQKELPLRGFLKIAKQSKTTIEEFEKLVSQLGLQNHQGAMEQPITPPDSGRNVFLFNLGLTLKKSGLKEADIARVLVEKNQVATAEDHPNFAIKGPVSENELGTIIQSVKQMLANEDQDKVSTLVASLNSTHAHIMVAGKAKIMNSVVDPNNNWRTYDFSTPADFKSRYSNQKVMVGGKLKTAAEIWLQHPNRRSYDGITFNPAGASKTQFNTFQGFPIDPKAGDCSLYLRHIRENICGCDDDLYHYVISWMADAIQNPAKRPGIALAIRGKQGVGKGVFVNHFASLFGPHYIQITQSSHLVGNFNAHLRDMLLVYADEAIWAGDKRAESVLKGLITEDHLAIEMKGVDVQTSRNFSRIIMTSNNDWIVPASIDQRRFVVIEASPARIQDSRYFKAIADQMEAGGLEALMYTLVNWDLEGINLRKIPRTGALVEQQLRSLGPVGQWLYGCLELGGIQEFNTGDGTYFRDWPEKYATKDMYDAYLGFCRQTKVRHPANLSTFGKSLVELLPGISKRREGTDKRKHFYILPDLEQARAEFKRANNFHSIDWGDDEDLLK
jgi:phage/plasmid-associated DNA primase